MSFEAVADEYDAARPSYPAGVYDALGDLTGLLVLDVGAGTGVATRQLVARGATVVAVDHGHGMLRRARARSAALPAVVADGVQVPVRTAGVDLICFAQAWHWLDESTRVAEAHRVLRPGGRWAGWWSHARADDEPWFDEYWSLLERHFTGVHRAHRDVDWGAAVADAGQFEVGARVTVPWVRELSVDRWTTEQVTISYIAALPQPDREPLIRRLRAIADARFPTGTMTIPYETWLWCATKV